MERLALQSAAARTQASLPPSAALDGEGSIASSQLAASLSGLAVRASIPLMCYLSAYNPSCYAHLGPDIIFASDNPDMGQ